VQNARPLFAQTKAKAGMQQCYVNASASGGWPKAQVTTCMAWLCTCIEWFSDMQTLSVWCGAQHIASSSKPYFTHPESHSQLLIATTATYTSDVISLVPALSH
jgi:hypothetical protein